MHLAKLWKDRIVSRPKTYSVTNNIDGTATFTPAPGAVVQEGTLLNAENMNTIEKSLAEVSASVDLIYTEFQALIRDLQEKNSGTSNSLSIVEGEVLSLTTTVASLTTTVANIATTVGQHTTSLSTLNANVSQHATDISNINTVIGQHTTSLSTLNATVSQHTTDISSVNTTVGQHTTSIGTNAATISSHGERLDALEHTVNDTYYQQLWDHENRIDALEGT